MRFVLNPLMDYYAARRATGREKLSSLKEPVILVANHASHMDTPVILSALPRKLRKRTAVAAAADYFYRNRLVASLVSLIFNTVPIERKGGGGLSKDGSHLDTLLDQGWNLLLYPEGTRSRGGGPGRVRRGAAVLAAAHNLSIIPIRVTGTAEAMPPGRLWPRRLRGKLLSKRHRITVAFGEPILPNGGDTAALIERVQSFFDNGDGGPSRSPYRRRPPRPRRSPARRSARPPPRPRPRSGHAGVVAPGYTGARQLRLGKGACRLCERRCGRDAVGAREGFPTTEDRRIGRRRRSAGDRGRSCCLERALSPRPPPVAPGLRGVDSHSVPSAAPAPPRPSPAMPFSPAGAAATRDPSPQPKRPRPDRPSRRSVVVLVEPVGRPGHRLAPLAVAALAPVVRPCRAATGRPCASWRAARRCRARSRRPGPAA